MPLNPSTLTLASVFTCFVSLLAIFFALRGRRIGDHTICRKCKFDLFGLPSTSHNCPECGADLNRQRATRIGRRKMRRPLFAITLLLFCAGASWLSIVGIMTARHEDWNQHKPVAWLMREVTASATRDQALTELMRRLAKKELSDNDIDALAVMALAHQANRNDPWFPKWGQFMQAAHNWKLKPERWNRYLQQSVDRYELHLRPEVRRGQPIPFRITRLPTRGTTYASGLPPAPPLFHVDGQVLRTFAVTGSIDGTKGPYEAMVDLPLSSVMQFDLGEHQAGITINFESRIRPVARFPSSASEPEPGNHAYEFQARVTHMFRLIDKSQPTARMYFDADLDAKVEAALTFSVTADRSLHSLNVTINNAGVPVDMAFKGELSAGKLHRDLGLLIFPANKPNQATILLRDVLQFWDPDKVDLQLTPSLDAAEYTVDMYKIWGGQVTRHDVAVAKSLAK